MRPWIAIFVVAVLVRGLLMASWLVPHAQVVAGVHIEVEAVARSLVAGRGYANPYKIPTGPTAHPLPIQTLLQALLYWLFGVTPAAAYARCVLGICSIAAVFATLPWLTGELGLGRRAGIVGGMAAAVVPWQGLGDVLGYASNEAQATVALGVLMVWYLRRWKATGPLPGAGSLALGAFAGFAFHLAPALLPVLLACALFELWWARGRRPLTAALAVCAGVILACAPWAWRNSAALDEAVFIRSNFGLELRLGNHEGARADLWSTGDAARLHPGNDESEARRVRDLGEATYMREARDEAIGWIRAHPGEFLALTAARAWHVWFGPPARPLEALSVAALTVLALLGLGRALPHLTTPERAALLIPLVAYPLVYYLVGYIPRYTFPLTAVLFALAGATLPMRSGSSRATSRGDSGRLEKTAPPDSGSGGLAVTAPACGGPGRATPLP
jgi:hypothetical protein